MEARVIRTLSEAIAESEAMAESSNVDKYGAHKVMKEITEREMVNHPDHYQGNKTEVIDIIEDYNLGFSLGNAIKYILRADKKGNKKQDLEKAIWYLERELSKFRG
jgi:translation initiation factor 2B subunit (eIF-2B alpha/beta/delta family)